MSPVVVSWLGHALALAGLLLWLRALLPNEAPFAYADYVKAREVFNEALKGGCFYGLLTGPSGMGKTELLGDLAKDLARPRYHLI